jgi:inhibitor of cysteine peptidase
MQLPPSNEREHTHLPFLTTDPLMKSLLLLLLFSAINISLAADTPVATTPGHQFTITLQANHTTGYSWKLAKPLGEKQVQLQSIDYKQTKPGQIAGGGQEVWTFKAVAEGKTGIHLKYVRPWETNVPPVQTTNFLVGVKKGN